MTNSSVATKSLLCLNHNVLRAELSISAHSIRSTQGSNIRWSVQGEDQKKLDVISNDIFCNTLRSSGRTGVIASEEEDLPVAVENTLSGNYVVVFDPLDGSSNIDAGISVGSIFGVRLLLPVCHPVANSFSPHEP